MPSSSLAADRLMRTLYFATLLHAADEILEGQRGFLDAVAKGLEILGILGQGVADGGVDQVRNALLGFGGLEPQ